jgi:hypothetical protein
MVFSGVDRYTYGYSHIPLVANQFSNDLTILNKKLATIKSGPTALVVDQRELPFYHTVAKYNSNITVTGAELVLPVADTVIVSREGQAAKQAGPDPSEILTNDRYKKADRFYIYKTP